MAAQTLLINSAAGNVSVPNATETVVATTRAASSAYAGCTFGVLFVVQLTTPALLTSAAFTIRRTGLTGTAVYTGGALTVGASAILALAFGVTDAPAGDVAGLAWVLTCTTAGGAAAATAALAYSVVTVPV